MKLMSFQEAYELPIGNHVEKKGKFSYLSWAFAVKHLRENFPDAQWEIHENKDGLPVFNLVDSSFVKVSVVFDGQIFTQWHPVLDYKNKPIVSPTSFDINTAIQRCLTKAIALATGLGLGLYAGEDLPRLPDEEKKTIADYIILMDKAKDLEDLTKIFKKNAPKIRQELGEEGIEGVKSYNKQLAESAGWLKGDA